MASINASTSGAGGVITTADATGILNIQTAGTNAVTVDASQNVGIGTTSPSVPLAVYKASDSSINIQNSTSGVTNVDGLQLLLSGSNGYMWNYESGANIFGTANTERMRIDSGGGVFLGKTTAAETTAGWYFTPGAGNVGLSTGNYFVINYVPGGAATMIDFRTGGVSTD